ncbi:MAG: hypothetical protein ABWY54_08360 [Glaciihabitans sp.]
MSSTFRTPVTSSRARLLALGIIVVLAPALVACSGEQVQGIVSDATGGAVDVGGSSLPSDFPGDIPLADGTVVSGNRVGNADGAVWNVTITVADPTLPSELTTRLTEAGFRSTSDIPGMPDTGGTAAFTNDEHAIVLVVTDNSDATFTANYTVTTVPR